MQLISSAHCVFNLKVHLVFVVVYRRKTITKPIITRMSEIFHAICEDSHCKLREFSGESDHVHLLVGITPSVRISVLIRRLKSIAAKTIRQEFGNQLHQYLWGDRFWTKSYCAITVGAGATNQIIERYIRKQKSPSSYAPIHPQARSLRNSGAFR